ncbi:MAG: dihydrofolate reductase family protein [Chloroflexota bacterium]
MSKVFGGMAASLDGYIATKDGDLSWLNNAMSPDEDYKFSETAKRTGAYVMGANTYREIAASGVSAGGDKTPTYVVTHEQVPKRPRGNITFYAGDLRELVRRIKSETEKDICLWGGGNLVTQFVDLDLVDELGVSIIPVLLGDGVPFFGRIAKRKKLRLIECKQFPSGIVLLNYAF